MKLIHKRITRLEHQLGCGSEPSAQDLKVWQIAETIRRRRAERLGETFIPRPLEVHPAGPKMSIAETICSLRFVRFTSRVRVCVTVVLQVEESSSNGE